MATGGLLAMAILAIFAVSLPAHCFELDCASQARSFNFAHATHCAGRFPVRRFHERHKVAQGKWQVPADHQGPVRPASASPAQQVFVISVIASDPDQFSAWSDAEAIFSGVVSVSVVLAPCGLLLMAW